jgi:hypothetical protein
LHISYPLSPTFFTLAPSTKISIFSRVVFPHKEREFFIDAAPNGSTPIIFVFFSKALVTSMIPETSHPQPIGQII